MISVEAARVDNVIVLDYLASEVALEDPGIGSTDPNIPIYNTCTDDELHVGLPRGSDDNEDLGDEWDMHDAIPTASRRRQPLTVLERCDLGTTDVERYEGVDGEDEDADEAEDVSQADDGSTQNVED